MKFTTASNTSTTKGVGMYNWDCNIKRCNYLKNEVAENEGSVISCAGSNTFTSCSFIGNKRSYLFSSEQTIDNYYFSKNNVNHTVAGKSTIF